MAHAFDPEIAAALQAAAAAMGEITPPARGDWASLRANIDGLMAALGTLAPSFPDVTTTNHTCPAPDGTSLRLRWYEKTGATPGPAVLYLHGGGMICGNIDIYDPVVAAYVSATGVSMLAADYRLAPENPHPTPVEDCAAALQWLLTHAAQLGADPTRIAVMGDSAGGGLAAGTALLARDRNLPLARPILIYPMLDDRNLEPDPALAPFATWTHDNNFTGWSALLGDLLGTAAVPSSAAPARAETLTGLAPAYIEVGELDIFRDESIAYAARLAQAGIPTELHVHPGAPHAFERVAPASTVAQRAMADRLRVLLSL
jgi:acetyl esterase/lipase